MASTAFLPRPDYGPDCHGKFLTFVVPSRNGCNLDCSFCLIRQRREIATNHFNPDDDYIGPDDLALFVRQVTERWPIIALAIQGHEPLLPSSLPYTRALLTEGGRLGIPTGLVTNGVLLGEAIDLLSVLMPTAIAVSLDASSANQHDRIRGVPGSWAAAIRGITRAVMTLTPRTSLVVSSVLQPSKRRYLDDLPAQLRELGVDYWIVNPQLRVGRDRVGGPVGNPSSIFQDLMILQKAANRAGIRLIVDDEFDHLHHGVASMREPELRSLHIRTQPPSVEIFRLTPTGQCSVGQDILKKETPGVPRWRPNEVNAGEFVARRAARVAPRAINSANCEVAGYVT